MLDAALAMVNDTGLTVSLEHISFEDVIRDAGVSRSAVYRRWPYKDLFFSDLLRELAQGMGLDTVTDSAAGVELARQLLRDHLDRLDTAEHRHSLFVDMLRQSALRDFETIYTSTQWRTYIALHASFLSLADGELRDDVHTALAASEQKLVARISSAYEQLAGLLGYRLRPGLTDNFETMATLLSATMQGLVIRTFASTETATRRIQADPFGVGPAEWSQPALGIVSIAVAFLEPDPTTTWDNEHLATIRQALSQGGPQTPVADDPPHSDGD